MFEALKTRLRRIQYLDSTNILKDVLEDPVLRQDIVDLNRYDQLYDKGIRPDGTLITPLYSNATVEYKIRDGQRWDHVTLNDKGHAYESFELKVDEAQIKITADLEKPGGNLTERYGEVLGLTEDNIAIVRGWIQPRVLPLVRAKVLG